MPCTDVKTLTQPTRLIRTRILSSSPGPSPKVPPLPTPSPSLLQRVGELPMNAVKRYREASKLGRSNMIVRNIFNANVGQQTMAFSYAQPGTGRDIITIWRTP